VAVYKTRHGVVVVVSINGHRVLETVFEVVVVVVVVFNGLCDDGSRVVGVLSETHSHGFGGCGVELQMVALARHRVSSSPFESAKCDILLHLEEECPVGLKASRS